MSGSFSGGNEKKSGSETITGNSASVTRALAPEGWEEAWRGLQAQLSPAGLTAPQQAGLDWMSAGLADGDAAGLGAARAGAGEAGAWFLNEAQNRGINTLATLPERWGAYYDPLQDVAAQGVAARDVAAQQVAARDVGAERVFAQQVAAQRGAGFMSDYQNPYMTDEVDASLADYDRGADEARTALRAATAGAFGNKRTGVAEGQFGADSALDRAKLAADLRAGGFNTAASLGMQDANRALAADQSNQSAALQAAMANQASGLQAALANQARGLEAATANQASGLQAAMANQARDLEAATTNAANRQAAQEFNATLQTQRDMFDIEQGKYYDQTRDSLMSDYLDALGTQAGLGAQQVQTNAGLVQGLIDSGGLGPAQQFAWLNAGTPLFGQSSDTSSRGTTASAGKASSKGGGLGFG